MSSAATPDAVVSWMCSWPVDVTLAPTSSDQKK